LLQGFEEFLWWRKVWGLDFLILSRMDWFGFRVGFQLEIWKLCNVQRNPSSIRLWNAILRNCRHKTTQSNQDPKRPHIKRSPPSRKRQKMPTQKNEKTEAGSQVWNARTDGRIQEKVWGKNICGVTGSRISRKEERTSEESRKRNRRIKKGLSKKLVFYW
jgi:hypothetical protein